MYKYIVGNSDTKEYLFLSKRGIEIVNCPGQASCFSSEHASQLVKIFSTIDKPFSTGCTTYETQTIQVWKFHPEKE